MEFQLDNEFDSFIRNRNRAKQMQFRKRKQYTTESHLDDNSNVTDSSRINNRRLKLQSRHKGFLARLKDVRFLNNRNNHPIIHNEMKAMAVEIDDLHKKLANSTAKVENKICSCGKKIRQKDKKYSNFVDTSQNGNRLLIFGVVAIGLLFFTPLGSKLLK
jgi:hypothetical protein